MYGFLGQKKALYLFVVAFASYKKYGCSRIEQSGIGVEQSRVDESGSRVVIKQRAVKVK